jgi:pantetheine-phosphate adenylyltransferase
VRLIGGQWKRSKLPVADRPGLRPTPDRVRETLFNWLGQDLSGWRVLDAFAGSGALGFEAASRGAAEVLLLERDAALAAACEAARSGWATRCRSSAPTPGLDGALRRRGASTSCCSTRPSTPACGPGAARLRALVVVPGGWIYLESAAAAGRAAGRRRAAPQAARAGAVHALLLSRAPAGIAAATLPAAVRPASQEPRAVTTATPLTAVYPGTFDPMTLGHEDLMRRASRLFDRLILAVAAGHHKRTMFTIAERLEIAARDRRALQATSRSRPSAACCATSSSSNGGKVVVRGLRAVSDFEYEFQMAGMNRQLMPEVETVFMTPSDQYQFVSGTFVREIASLGGDVSKFVAPSVLGG